MPESMQDLLWWGFNLATVGIATMIWFEIRTLRNELKEEREGRLTLAKDVARIEARCDERHKYACYGETR